MNKTGYQKYRKQFQVLQAISLEESFKIGLIENREMCSDMFYINFNVGFWFIILMTDLPMLSITNSS